MDINQPIFNTSTKSVTHYEIDLLDLNFDAVTMISKQKLGVPILMQHSVSL